MPGISFIFNPKDDLKQKESEILHSLESMLHTDQYKPEIFFHDNSCFLGCTKYKEYPMTIFESDDYCVYLEGRIYKNSSKIDPEINELVKRIFDNKNDLKTQVVEWLLNTDGDFVILIHHKIRNEIYIINDILGRLPLYYKNNNGSIMISRETQFILNFIPDKRFNKMSIAQYLLFGYSLGKRTLFENIYRLPPASLIKIDLNRSKIEMMTLHSFNFDDKNNKRKSVKEHVDNLIDIFCEACKNRSNGHDKNIVSLSGGLDSRAVAAGLIKSRVKFYGVTYTDYYKIGESDGVIAKELANALNIDWKIFYLDPPKGKNLFELLDIKNGLNFLGMSYILPFYKKIMKTYGSNIVNFSGDGGDKLIPDLRPVHNLRNLDDLVNYIIANHHVFSIDKVVQLTKIDKETIISELKAHLNSYPEQDFNQKYVHFMIFERGFKWLFEGEDRHRFYFWTLTPFYSIKFFNYVMNCPDNIKMRYNLYRQFLKRLSPRASAIDYSNWKMPIASNKSKLYLLTRDIYFKLPPQFTKPFRKRYKKALNLNKDDLKSIKCFLEVIRNCKSITKYIATDNVEDLKGVTKKEFYNMLTLISTMEKLEGRKCTIKKYGESDFP